MSSVRIIVSYDGEWVISPEKGIFRFNGSKAKGISVPKNITYLELLQRISQLLNVDTNEFTVSMKFLFSTSVPVAPAEIADDDDVNFFIAENSSEVSYRTPLCVTLERRGSNAQQAAYGEGSSQTFNPLPEAHEQMYEPFFPLTGIEENEPGFCVNNELDDGETLSEFAPENVPVEPQVGTVNPRSTSNIDPVTPAVPVAPRASHNQVACMTTKEDVARKDSFPPREDLAMKEDLNAASVDNSEDIEVKQLYTSKKELKKKLGMIAIKKNFEFKMKKSNKSLFVAECLDDNCKWRVRASKWRDSTSFIIRKLVKDHTCSVETRDHRQASFWVIAQHLRSKYEGMDQAFELKPKDIIIDIQKEFGVTLSYWKAWKAREYALSSDGTPPRPRRSTRGRPPGIGGPKHLRPNSREERKCAKCGLYGHYRKTCSTPTASDTSGAAAAAHEKEQTCSTPTQSDTSGAAAATHEKEPNTNETQYVSKKKFIEEDEVLLFTNLT
ncbi:hypothetical protein UlMin_023940 [Ulmus minor]